MAQFQKGRTKTGGRKAGVCNKTTQTRIDAAERAIVLAKAGGKRLAREVLEDFLELFSAIAMTHRPTRPGSERNPSQDEKKFEKFARLAVEVATALASYQTPKLKAVLVGPEQTVKCTKVNVTILNERGEKIYSDVPEDEGPMLIEGLSGEPR